MRRIVLLAALPIAALFMPLAHADDAKAEWQITAWGGEQHMSVDHGLHFHDETQRFDMWNNGIAIARRHASGFLVEVGAETSSHDTSEGKDNDFYIDHYTAALGWQIDAERWRITPKVGIARSKLGNQARLLLNENGGRVFERNFTVGYVEASVQRRLGNHWAIGANLRETFEDFGYSRSWGIVMTVNW